MKKKNIFLKKKNIFFILAILSIIVLLIGTVIYINKSTINNSKNNSKNNSNIPNGYIAIFHGGVGEITFETYIYKVDNGNANYGFEYINVTNTTVSWGSDEWNSKITKCGYVQWTDDVFEVAKENGAYSYVTLPNTDKIYTIEQYMDIFLTD